MHVWQLPRGTVRRVVLVWLLADLARTTRYAVCVTVTPPTPALQRICEAAPVFCLIMQFSTHAKIIGRPDSVGV